MRPAEVKAQYDAQGYVYIPQAFSTEEVGHIRTAFERVAENDTLINVIACNEVFVDVVDHPSILPVVRAVIGDDVQLRYANGNIRRAGTESGGGWHCDLSDITCVELSSSVIMTKVFTYLTDVPENGDTFGIVPGSHRFPLGQPLPDIAEPENMPDHVCFPVKAGDALLFNGYCWHARFHNRSQLDRIVLEYSYVHSWMRAQYDWREMPPDIREAVTRTHNRRQLFGVPEPGFSDLERRLEWAEPVKVVEVGS